jgi:hypothetical protein
MAANWTRGDTRALIEAADERPAMSKWVVRTIRRHGHEAGLVARMARLEAFVVDTERTSHIWGVSDCSLAIADWAMANGYDDGAADLRGTYETEDACRAVLAARGGLVPTVAACASRLGLHPLSEPEFGCIAVIGSAVNPDRQWSAIWQGHAWLVRWGNEQRAQWVPFAAKPLAMWRISFMRRS